MARLIYGAIASLDGYIADSQGHFDWAAPDEEVHAFVNRLQRPIGTYLYGRRMYEVMRFWETADEIPNQAGEIRDFAGIWRAADKVVFSKTLKDVSTAKTRIERDFDPEAIRRMKAMTKRDISVAGPDLAAHAIKSGLVDDWLLFLVPILAGRGKAIFPRDVRVSLELLEDRRFRSGLVYLRYRTS